MDIFPSDWEFSLRVEHSWVLELTILVLGSQCSLGFLCNLDETSSILLILEVLVKVVLKVLDHVHLFLDECILSDSWERKRLIIEFPSSYTNSIVFIWVDFFQLVSNFDGVVIILNIEMSGEIVQLDKEFFF